MNKKVVIRQNGYKDCAVACLLSIIRYYNGNIAREELSYLIKTNENGTSAYHMLEGMKKIGFDGYGIKKTSDEILNEQLPVIAHVQINNILHYIVIYEVNLKRKYFKIMDPAYGMKKISFDEFNKIFLSTLLIFYPISIIPNIKHRISLWNYLYKYILTKKEIIIRIIILSFVVILLTLINNYYFKIIIDYILVNYSTSFLLIATFLFSVIIFLKNMFDYFRSKLLIKINNFINVTLTNNVIRHIMNLPYQFFKTKPTGEVVSRINELNNFKSILSQLFLNLFVDIFLILISMVALFIINKNLFIITAIIILLYTVIVFLYSKIYKTKIYHIQTQEGMYSKELVESLEGYETIKNLNLINTIVDKLNIKFIGLINKIKSFEKSLINQTLTKNIMFDLGILIILSLGTYFAHHKLFSLGDLVVYNTLLLFLLEPIKQLLDLEPNLRYVKTSYDRINDLLMIREEERNNIDNNNLDGDIKIKNLSYSYNDMDYIFQNINLNIERTSKILIYGKSGSGKSTLAKILLKYIDSYKGEIYINDLNLKDIKNELIKNTFIYVSQNEILFADTLENNVLLNRDITINEYEEILKLSKVDKIRDNKKFRNMFYIEENGFNLSGGERQKIILARALLKKGNYLILDEALSEVGFEEEIEIIKGIFNKFKDKTIIYISHKKEVIKEFEYKYRFYQKGELC